MNNRYLIMCLLLDRAHLSESLNLAEKCHNSHDFNAYVLTHYTPTIALCQIIGGGGGVHLNILG